MSDQRLINLKRYDRTGYICIDTKWKIVRLFCRTCIQSCSAVAGTKHFKNENIVYKS